MKKYIVYFEKGDDYLGPDLTKAGKYDFLLVKSSDEARIFTSKQSIINYVKKTTFCTYKKYVLMYGLKILTPQENIIRKIIL